MVKKPVVRENEIVIRDMMNVVLALDHRYGDGSLLVSLIGVIKQYFEDPENFNLDSVPDRVPYHELSARRR